MENKPVFDIKNFPDEWLFSILENNFVPTVPVAALSELVRRLYSTIEEQQKEIESLKTSAPAVPQKQRGRKREKFYMGKGVMDDEYLIYLIDNEFYTFNQLEQELGAGKNQLRNRYNRAKVALGKNCNQNK